jgi:hypothetical protein
VSGSRAGRAPAAAALGLVAALLAGCMGGAAGYLQVRPERLYERQPLDTEVSRVIGRVELHRSAFAVFGIPFSSPNVAAAIDSRVQESDADAITNIEVAMSLHTFFFVFGASRYDVTGDLIKFDKGEAK